MLDGPEVESEGREPTCVQGWGKCHGDTPRHHGAAPLAPPASLQAPQLSFTQKYLFL